jgi:hypothetical protein
MDKVELTFDSAEFARALRDYETASQKEMSEILNEKGIKLSFEAAKQLAGMGDVKRYYGKGSPLFHSLAATGATKFGQAVKGQGNKKLADKIYESRVRAKNYARAMCLAMASHLGGNVRLVKAKSIKHAGASKAKPGMKIEVRMWINKAQEGMINDVIGPAIKKALVEQVLDMDKYSQPRLAKAAKKHSGRKR